MGWKGETFAFPRISLCFPLNFTAHTAFIYLKRHANVKKVCPKCVNFNIIGRQASGMGQNRLPLSLGSGVEGCGCCYSITDCFYTREGKLPLTFKRMKAGVY